MLIIHYKDYKYVVTLHCSIVVVAPLFGRQYGFPGGVLGRRFVSIPLKYI